MMKSRGRSGLGLALGLVLALTAQTSNAGSLEIDLTIAGFPGGTIQITPTSSFAIPNADPALDATLLTVDTGALNAYLALFGYSNVSFSSFGASSNNPGTSSNAFVTQNGTVNLTAGSGSVSFTSVAFNTGFTTPSDGIGTLHSSSTSTFTNTAAGDSQTFQSWFNPNNTSSTAVPPAFASPSLAFTSVNLANSTASFGGTANTTNVGYVQSPYALINESSVTITAVSGQSPTIAFGGSTVLTVVPIPEPASVVMTMSALPIVFGLIRRYRRGVKTVG